MSRANLYMRVHTLNTDETDVSSPGSTIVGEAASLAHAGEIQLESWHWEHKRRKTVSVATNDFSQPSVLTFSKLMDASTTELLAWLSGDVDGAVKEIPLVVVDMIDDPRESPFGLTVKFFNVRPINFQLSSEGSGSNMQLKESWTFDYDSVEFAYWPDFPGNWEGGGFVSFALDRPWDKDEDPKSKNGKGNGTGLGGDQARSLDHTWQQGRQLLDTEGLPQPRSVPYKT